jgi:hypothetical protein
MAVQMILKGQPMFRKLLLSGATVLALTSASYADLAPVQSVDVTADITAIQNAKAAAYWTNVSADLKEAIAARLVDRLGEKGSTVSIDVNELSLANSFQTSLNIDDAVLVGQVNVSNAYDNTKFDSYELSVSQKAATAFAPDGKALEGVFTDSPEYYRALIAAFADGVVSRLK